MKFHGIVIGWFVVCSAVSGLQGMDSSGGHGGKRASAAELPPPESGGILSAFSSALGMAKKGVNKVAYGDPDIYLFDKIRDGSFARLSDDDRRDLLNDGLREWTKKINEVRVILERRRTRETFITTCLLDNPEFLVQVSPDILAAAKHEAHELTLIAQQVDDQFTKLLDEQRKGIHKVIDGHESSGEA